MGVGTGDAVFSEPRIGQATSKYLQHGDRGYCKRAIPLRPLSIETVTAIL